MESARQSGLADGGFLLLLGAGLCRLIDDHGLDDRGLELLFLVPAPPEQPTADVQVKLESLEAGDSEEHGDADEDGTHPPLVTGQVLVDPPVSGETDECDEHRSNTEQERPTPGGHDLDRAAVVHLELGLLEVVPVRLGALQIIDGPMRLRETVIQVIVVRVHGLLDTLDVRDERLGQPLDRGDTLVGQRGTARLALELLDVEVATLLALGLLVIVEWVVLLDVLVVRHNS